MKLTQAFNRKKETKCHENEEGWEVCSRSLMLWIQNPLESLLQITRAAHTTSHSVGLGEGSSVSISDKFPSGADAEDLGGYPWEPLDWIKKRLNKQAQILIRY